MGLPDWAEVLGLAVAASVFWSLLGWKLARRLVPTEVPALCVAPMLGWCVHTAISCALLRLLPFSLIWTACLAVGLLGACCAWPGRPAMTRMPMALVVVAGVMALVPLAGVMPKLGTAGVSLSAPMFDHLKIAVVQAMLRGGMPPGDSFYGGPGAGDRLTYYWWWHGSAAELARLSGCGGWAADAALTGFTAFATLLLVAGIGVALGGPWAGGTALALCAAGPLRPMLPSVLERSGLLHDGSGLGAWLNQASWAPQHMAAGGALVLAALMLARLAVRPGAAGVAVLACAVAAGFGSSAWVGGITCAVALPVVGLVLMWRMAAARRARFVGAAAIAAAVALVLVAPLLREEWVGAQLRQAGAAVVFAAYPVFGTAVPRGLRGALNLAGFPLLLLVEFPAVAVAGAFGVARAWRRAMPEWQAALVGLGIASLGVCAVLRSTIDNNDLGWRAVVPALLGLTPFAAERGWAWLRQGAARQALAALPWLAGLWGNAAMLRDALAGNTARVDPGFAASQAGWAALRAASGGSERVASDPRGFARMTLWPANIGWALLADRPSCYAGWAASHPLVPLPAMALYRVDLLFGRVFDGAPLPGDVAALAGPLHCRLVLLLPGDGAWRRDPFAASRLYRPVANAAGFRLYRAVPNGVGAWP